jgi:cyclic pyranopterin monophosphate synthase
VVIVTGGTGISERDRTPEALVPLFDRELPGFGERLRERGSLQTRYAWLSRACAGIAAGTLVVALPGSRGGVRDGLAVLDESLDHALHVLRGGDHGPRGVGAR